MVLLMASFRLVLYSHSVLFFVVFFVVHISVNLWYVLYLYVKAFDQGGWKGETTLGIEGGLWFWFSFGIMYLPRRALNFAFFVIIVRVGYF